MQVFHYRDLLEGAAALAIVAHAVNSFPTPVNKYGSWLLGVVQFAVGQRIAGANTMQGKDTVAAAVPRGDGAVLAAISKGTGN